MAARPEDNNPPQGQQLDIELSEDVAEGIYCNLAMIGHSNTEFVIDFIRLMPGVPKAKVKSRIVITPEHAMRLLGALRENLERYEESFGDIKQQQEGLTLPFGFGGQIGQA
jgi:hypothetical protein